MLLQQPLQFKGLTLRNRIVMPPMATNKTLDGSPCAEQIAYYRERAKGTALIIAEHAYILPEGMASGTQLSMADDHVIDGFRALTDAIHGEGCLAVAQLNHAGAKALGSGLCAKAPSAIETKAGGLALAMSEDDISHVIEGFAAAALRARRAGFDGVEIHSAHGYLLNQFYSPLTNLRSDAYGAQSLEGRTRLHCEVIRAVRAAVGEDYPIAVRFGACDYLEGGSRIEEVPAAALAFEQAGADLIDISGGLCGYMLPGRTDSGYFRECSRAAKSALSVPVILTGGVTTAQEMESLLEAEAADLIGVGRAMLRDAHWSLKALGLEA